MSMRRRKFIAFVCGAIAWPLATRGQQPDRVRRVGVLISGLAEDDPETRARITTFEQELSKSGWITGQNIRLDYRYGRGDPKRIRDSVADLVATPPDVILAGSSVALIALQQATRTVPIVFVQVVDPVGSGFVTSLAKPGGNITGFANYDYEIGGKWLETLKEIAPRIRRVAILRDPSLTQSVGQLGAIQASAQSVGVTVSPVGVREPGEIEQAINTFGREPNGGLIVVASSAIAVNRKLIIALAAAQHLPAIYPYRYYCESGGLVSYGVDPIDLWRRGASYVDRILHGERPADLPVQAPTKLQLVINLKTAKALDLSVPAALLARADEVIE
jgi:putative ABC transport system substrate-binding protein